MSLLTEEQKADLEDFKNNFLPFDVCPYRFKELNLPETHPQHYLSLIDNHGWCHWWEMGFCGGSPYEMKKCGKYKYLKEIDDNKWYNRLIRWFRHYTQTRQEKDQG